MYQQPEKQNSAFVLSVWSLLDWVTVHYDLLIPSHCQDSVPEDEYSHFLWDTTQWFWLLSYNSGLWPNQREKSAQVLCAPPLCNQPSLPTPHWPEGITTLPTGAHYPPWEVTKPAKGTLVLSGVGLAGQKPPFPNLTQYSHQLLLTTTSLWPKDPLYSSALVSSHSPSPASQWSRLFTKPPPTDRLSSDAPSLKDLTMRIRSSSRFRRTAANSCRDFAERDTNTVSTWYPPTLKKG